LAWLREVGWSAVITGHLRVMASAPSTPTRHHQPAPMSASEPRFGVVGFNVSASAEKGQKFTIVSPGPVYLPEYECKVTRSPEYTMRVSHRYSVDQRNTKQILFPGPKYTMPNGLGRQPESTKRSYTLGKFSTQPRNTLGSGPERSPGPAAYDRDALGLVTVARAREPNKKITTGMGAAARFFDSETRTGSVPGPGRYQLPEAIGGKALPNKASQPVFAFGRDDARHVHSIKEGTNDGCSPGPGAKYTLRASCGGQVSSLRPTSAKYGFGTSSRFPVPPDENRAHQEALMRIQNRSESIANRRAQSAGAQRPYS